MTTDLHQIDDLIRNASDGLAQFNRAAATLGMDPVDLANAMGLDATTFRNDPQREELHRRLVHLCLVLRAATEIIGSSTKAARHLGSTPIRILGDRTLLKTVVDGDHEMALRYLKSISGGQNG